MGIKITTADKHFSKCVRERVDYVCERCNTQYDRSSSGLHCSHFHGRGNWSVRHDPLNAFAHCYACHIYFESNPYEFTHWYEEKVGEGMAAIVRERKNDTGLGKSAKQAEKAGEIAKHYLAELKKLKEARASGVTGRIDFDGFY